MALDFDSLPTEYEKSGDYHVHKMMTEQNINRRINILLSRRGGITASDLKDLEGAPDCFLAALTRHPRFKEFIEARAFRSLFGMKRLSRDQKTAMDYFARRMERKTILSSFDELAMRAQGGMGTIEVIAKKSIEGDGTREEATQ